MNAFPRALTLIVLLPTMALAQPHKKDGESKAPPCGTTFLPIVAGNSWTYKNPAPVGKAPDHVTVKIDSVQGGVKDAKGKPMLEIKVTETYGTRTLALTWTCTTEDGLSVPPESFFFSGEPGGGLGMTVKVLTRKGVTLAPDSGVVPKYGWQEELKAEATRADLTNSGVVHPVVQLKLDRSMIVEPAEQVVVPAITANAQKVTFELRGRAFLEEAGAVELTTPDAHKCSKTETKCIDIPIKRPGAMYFVKGYGIVKIDDAFDKTWELESSNVQSPK